VSKKNNNNKDIKWK